MKKVLVIVVSALTVLGCARLVPWLAQDLGPGYQLVVWDYRQPLPGSEYLYAEYLAHVIEDFTRDNPSIKVTFKLLNWLDARDELERELSVGTPPDVFGTVLADRLFDVTLQVPAGRPEAMTAYWPAAVSALTRDGVVWGYPRWLSWELWAVNRRMLGSEHAVRLAVWQREGWNWTDLEAAVGRRTAGVDLTTPAFWQSAVAAAGGSPRSLQETPDQLMALAGTVARLVQAGILPRDPQAAAGIRIERFFQGQTPVLGPVNAYLARYLENRIDSRSGRPDPAPAAQDVVWLPFPSPTSDPFVPWQVSAYYVFRRQGPDADGRAAAAARLAAYLARRMGRWGAEHLGVVPAYRDDLVFWALESGLTLDLRVAMTRNLDRTLGPLLLSDEADFWEQAYLQALVPMLVKALPRALPADLGARLRTELEKVVARP